jgi:hypothetical protein
MQPTFPHLHSQQAGIMHKHWTTLWAFCLPQRPVARVRNIITNKKNPKDPQKIGYLI